MTRVQVLLVDTSVLMYAVGRARPLKAEAEAFFESVLRGWTR